jgi:hypothetical protein
LWLLYISLAEEYFKAADERGTKDEQVTREEFIDWALAQYNAGNVVLHAFWFDVHGNPANL